MASWEDIARSHPDFARRAKELFDLHKHKTLATLRRDGSPRISGTEISFVDDDVWLGAMWQSRKAQDLRRDPRFALHGPTVNPDGDWKGDVKLSGNAREVWDDGVKRKIGEGDGGSGKFHLFRADIEQLVVTSVAGDHLQIDVWEPEAGLRTFTRN